MKETRIIVTATDSVCHIQSDLGGIGYKEGDQDIKVPPSITEIRAPGTRDIDAQFSHLIKYNRIGQKEWCQNVLFWFFNKRTHPSNGIVC